MLLRKLYPAFAYNGVEPGGGVSMTEETSTPAIFEKLCFDRLFEAHGARLLRVSIHIPVLSEKEGCRARCRKLFEANCDFVMQQLLPRLQKSYEALPDIVAKMHFETYLYRHRWTVETSPSSLLAVCAETELLCGSNTVEKSTFRFCLRPSDGFFVRDPACRPCAAAFFRRRTHAPLTLRQKGHIIESENSPRTNSKKKGF